MIFTFYSLLILSASWSASAAPFEFYQNELCQNIQEYALPEHPKTLSRSSYCFDFVFASNHSSYLITNDTYGCASPTFYHWATTSSPCIYDYGNYLSPVTAQEGNCYDAEFRYYQLSGCPPDVTFEYASDDPYNEDYYFDLVSASSTYSSYSDTRSPNPTSSYSPYYPVASALTEREREEKRAQDRRIAIGASIGGAMGMTLLLYCIFSLRAKETRKRKQGETDAAPITVTAPRSDLDARDEIRHAERLARLNGYYAPGTNGSASGNRPGRNSRPGVSRAEEDPRASMGSLPTYDEAMREHDEAVRAGRRSITIPLPAYVVDNDGEYRPVPDTGGDVRRGA